MDQSPDSLGGALSHAASDSEQSSERDRQVVFRYCDNEGRLTREANPNGSARSIAGICNRERNVMGPMPHPERCSEPILGNADGLLVFKSIAAAIVRA
jgi:phosphoribosylformylglycinamidine synthase